MWRWPNYLTTELHRELFGARHKGFKEITRNKRFLPQFNLRVLSRCLMPIRELERRASRLYRKNIRNAPRVRDRYKFPSNPSRRTW